MKTEEQLGRLHEAMEILNRENVTTEEVVELFSTLTKAVKTIREDLEGKIQGLDKSGKESNKAAVSGLKDVEKSLKTLIRELPTHADLEALKRLFKTELGGVMELIPTIPDFKSMVKEVEAKIPEVKAITAREIRDKLESLKGDDRLENSAVQDVPKITVSMTEPLNPKFGDLWMKI